MNDNVKKVLRWIAVPFAAVAAYCAAGLISVLFTKVNPSEMILLDQLLDWSLKGVLQSVAFVLAAAYVAPSGKKIVSVVFATIGCLVTAVLLALIIVSGVEIEWFKWSYYLLSIVGFIYASYLVINEIAFND